LMSEEIADPRVSLLALLKILPFLFVFLLNHLVLFRYMRRAVLAGYITLWSRCLSWAYSR
jgi:hypothetical protein